MDEISGMQRINHSMKILQNNENMHNKMYQWAVGRIYNSKRDWKGGLK